MERAEGSSIISFDDDNRLVGFVSSGLLPISYKHDPWFTPNAKHQTVPPLCRHTGIMPGRLKLDQNRRAPFPDQDFDHRETHPMNNIHRQLKDSLGILCLQFAP